MTKLLSRDQYYEQSKGKRDRKCPFCHTDQIVLHQGVNWNWIAASSPYMKYQTMLVPKRHINRMSELSEDEWLELNKLQDEIIETYMEAKIVWDDSGLQIENLFFGWRFRNKLLNERLNFQELDHLHLHIFPDREHHLDSLIQPDSHEWDYRIFMNKLRE